MCRIQNFGGKKGKKEKFFVTYGCLKVLRDWESLREMPKSLNAGDGRQININYTVL